MTIRKPDGNRLLNVDDIRERLGDVSRPRAYAVMERIPGRVNLGRSVRIPEAAWEAFITAGGYRNDPAEGTEAASA